MITGSWNQFVFCLKKGIRETETSIAFQNSVVSIIVGVYSFFLGINLICMACAHTQYTFLEKTTNESVIC